MCCSHLPEAYTEFLLKREEETDDFWKVYLCHFCLYYHNLKKQDFTGSHKTIESFECKKRKDDELILLSLIPFVL